jgi:hypothetical protein
VEIFVEDDEIDQIPELLRDPGFEYIRKLGLSDTIYGGGLQGEDDGSRPDNNFTTDLPDKDVLTDLYHWGCIVQEEQLEEEINLGLLVRFPWTFIKESSIIYEECQFQWPEYRRQYWALHVRAQIFFRG